MAEGLARDMPGIGSGRGPESELQGCRKRLGISARVMHLIVSDGARCIS